MNLKPVREPSTMVGHGYKSKRKRRRLRTVAMLPTLLTLGNLYLGFLALYCCGRELQDLGEQKNPATVLTMNSRRIEAIAPTFLSIAVFLLIGAMVCDALDGRVARMTGHSSKFGIQMDSLADIVSFGIAPGLMMVTMLRRELAQASLLPVGFDRFGQAGLLIAAIYVCCAALRLARFNVEATLEEAAHRGFRGLPSPGAASAVISLIFLHDHLDALGNWSRTAGYLTVIIPPCTLLVGLLMVSRVPYTHMVSALLSRRPFGHVVLVLLGMLLFLLYTELMAVALAWSFVISGIVRYIWRRAVGGVVPLVPEEGDHVGNENGNELERQAE